MIEISKIKMDGGTQARTELNPDAVAEYAEAYKSGASMPAVTVFYDGSAYWLADGYHRYFGALAAGLTDIYEDVILGTKRDAILFSLSANSKHGLRRTNADKRRAVETLLADSEWKEWSSNAIAKACGVGDHLVAEIRKSYLRENEDTQRTVQRNGKTYEQDTTNIGKKPEPLDEKDEEYNPKEDELQEAYNTVAELADQNDQLKDRLAALAPTESDRTTIEIIADLRAQIKTLEAVNSALTASRDKFQYENAEMMKQMARQRKEIEKLKGGKNASA